MHEELAGLRDQLAAAARQLAQAGLAIGTSGNLSARAGDHVAITPTGGVLAELEADQITVIDLDANVVGGTLAPTSEVDLHLGVYARYGAGAVVHTHPPVGTALSCVLEELPCIHYTMLALGGDVRVAPYRTFGTPELAAVTLDALEGKAAALMANHGAIAYGVDIKHAVSQATLLEWACQLYADAAVIGPPRVLDDADRTAVIEAAMARNYGTTKEVAE